MAQVCNLLSAERALALLEGELVVLQHLKHSTHMLQMLRPCRAVDEDIIEEDKDKVAEKLVKHFVHQRLEH